jgi:selenocysteine lyase/cysteine desulfurase
VPGPSAIVAVPGAPDSVAQRLTAAGVAFSSRAGNLRFAVHFYNTAADVDLALEAAA